MSAAGIAKRIALGAAAVITAPAVAAARLEGRFTGSDEVFRLFAESLAVLPGLPGAYLRAAYYAGTLDDASREVHIGFGSVFVRRSAGIGRHASLGRYCVIGNARIGEGAMIGSRVSVPSGKRQHLDPSGRPSADVAQYDTVRIGPDCWIGEGAIVMADVGARSIVAAGAVVLAPMPDGALVGGNPARVLEPAAHDRGRET